MTVTRRPSIRDKLNLLLLMPLLATVLLALPFVAARVDEARAASSTASAATKARQIAHLVYAVQRERLAAVDHLAGERGHRHNLMLQQQAVVDDTVEDVRASLDLRRSPRLAGALHRIRGLDDTRRKVAAGTIEAAQAYQIYGTVTAALLGSIGLDAPTGSSAAASRHLATLDALLQANEQSSRAGAALILAGVDLVAGRNLLAEVDALREHHTRRFLKTAGPGLQNMMRTVDEGASTHELGELSAQVRVATHDLGLGFVGQARVVAESQAVLRHVLLVRTARDVHQEANGEATWARSVAWTVGLATLVTFALVVTLGVVVSRSIADPIRRLTRAATSVAELARSELERVTDDERDDDRPRRLPTIAVDTRDEVGDLANAFNWVQTSAAQLVDRQVQSRRNIAQMFAGVARRTQNLVGVQLGLIDQLERDEQDPQLLAELYRLDHLSMRLRRSAESLLVVSGVRDETPTPAPATLATVLRSALAEIEDFRRVRLASVADVGVAPNLASDLSLLLAELLDNATSFSPPTTAVEVSAEKTTLGCRVSVVDHGIGLSDEQMRQENDRFLQRERLDIAPTTVLGLFVVGRLARRHALSVSLQPTPGGGVTAMVVVPARLLVASPPPRHRRRTDGGAEQAASPVAFPALTTPAPIPSAPATPPAAPAPTAPAPAAGVPSRPLPPPGVLSPSVAAAVAATLARISSAGGFDWFATASGGPAAARHAAGPPAGDPLGPGGPDLTAGPGDEPQARNGLTRRVPGANLSGVMQPRQRGPGPSQGTTPSRDPDRERASLEAFASAVARATAETGKPRSGPDVMREEGSTR